MKILHFLLETVNNLGHVRARQLKENNQCEKRGLFNLLSQL